MAATESKATAAAAAASSASDEKENSAFIVDFSGGAAAKGTLQDSFDRYRKAKAKALRLRPGKAKTERTPEEMEALRSKFVERCHHYLGVPYKQKYFEVGSDEWRSPIFLDCCGLVRRAMHDLEEDFGFRLGRGNQAYQFDTLRESEVEDPKMLKPGDLVFYEGDYVDRSKRPQKFRMVHVEVWLGGGDTEESTIAARWKKGKVTVFESFEFASKSWDNVTVRFCSIDPWLRGECVPAHPTLWKDKIDSGVRGKRSIFTGGDGEAADSDDDD